jgi:hypothetical protein
MDLTVESTTLGPVITGENGMRFSKSSCFPVAAAVDVQGDVFEQGFITLD